MHHSATEKGKTEITKSIMPMISVRKHLMQLCAWIASKINASYPATLITNLRRFVPNIIYLKTNNKPSSPSKMTMKLGLKPA